MYVTVPAPLFKCGITGQETRPPTELNAILNYSFASRQLFGM